jgi:hypothetical protein
MDATLKRRMWKVAIAHFSLSVFFFMTYVSYGFPAHSTGGGFTGMLQGDSAYAWAKAWADFWKSVAYLFQPHFLLLDKFGRQIDFPKWLSLSLVLVSIPTWSGVFSIFFVKLDNWLNHFPVLGKRVF